MNNGETWWITGASSGIGEALAKAVAARGASVILSGRKVAALEAVAAQCGDALVRPFFAAKPEKVPGAIHHALVGQALGARLRRAVTPAPTLEAPFSKDRVLAHHKGPLKTWLETGELLTTPGSLMYT